MLGRSLHIWNSPPLTPDEKPTLSLTQFPFDGGDGSDLVVAGGRIYVSMYNGNRVVVYNTIPTSSTQYPDFAIGSPDVCTNTLEMNYFITNGVPASNGRNLIISSDFDRTMSLWRQLPDEGRAIPDLLFFLPRGAWDNAIWGDTLALASIQTVYFWNKIPVKGEQPTLTFSNRIGNVNFQELRGVAVDSKYFFLADAKANKVYVWEGIPTQTSNPRYILDVEQPQRLSSDGEYLVVTATFSHSARIYPITSLTSNTPPLAIVGGVGKFNLPSHAVVSRGRLFVADTPFNRLHIWNDIRDAISGKSVDIILGKENLTDRIPRIGQNQLFWPGAVSYDGNYLWVGEFKFSNRVLRFKPFEPTSVNSNSIRHEEIRLYQNYPNPFNQSTMVSFSVPQLVRVELKVFDLLGKEVATIIEGEFSQGVHTRTFASQTLPTGTYVMRLRTPQFTRHKPLLILR